jgi:hypothetical protein
LAADYRSATAKALVVTSLTRPEALQPRNAHQLSVHPAGMAVDFRIPDDTSSRRWLETTLLRMEKDGLLDVTRERHPPHYHVAVFPKPYRAYAKKRDAADAVAAAIQVPALTSASVLPAASPTASAQSALPIIPVLGGAASGFAMVALLAVGGAVAGRKKARR